MTSKQARKFLNRLEELRYKYNQRVGQQLGENIVRRMVIKCMPKDIIKPLALHMETASTFQQIRKLMIKSAAMVTEENALVAKVPIVYAKKNVCVRQTP